MSSENTNCDVKVTKYVCTAFSMVRVKFWNDCELLMEGHRITPVVKKTRLYFSYGDQIKESVKFSGKGGDVLQICRDYIKIKKFEGEYDLKFDKEVNQYYIDLNEKVGSPRYHESRLGVKHVNPNHGEREKRDVSGLITIKEKGQKLIENTNKQKLSQVKNDVSDKTFMFGLINLLKEQCKDNIPALYTINTLEESIERRIK